MPPSIPKEEVGMIKKDLIPEVKKQLTNMAKYIQFLESSILVVQTLKDHSVKNKLHQRAVYASQSIKGLEGLHKDMQSKYLKYMDAIGAKKVPVVVKDGLRLVVNNTKRR